MDHRGEMRSPGNTGKFQLFKDEFSVRCPFNHYWQEDILEASYGEQRRENTASLRSLISQMMIAVCRALSISRGGKWRTKCWGKDLKTSEDLGEGCLGHPFLIPLKQC